MAIILAFGVGFAMARWVDRRPLYSLSRELEELRSRCNSAERMIGNQIGTWIASQSRNSYSQHREGPTSSPASRAENPGDVVAKRLVRVTKVNGRHREADLPRSITGLEERPPTAGIGYHVRMGGADVFHTSPVVRAEPGYIRTRHSSYQIEELHEYKRPSGIAEGAESNDGPGVYAGEPPAKGQASNNVQATPGLSAEREENRAKVRAIAFWFSRGWLVFAVGVNLLAVIGTMVVDAERGGAISKLFESYHPLNFAMWLEECLLFAPGFIAHWTYKRLPRAHSANP